MFHPLKQSDGVAWVCAWVLFAAFRRSSLATANEVLRQGDSATDDAISALSNVVDLDDDLGPDRTCNLDHA